ncbi:MAG: CDP-archaeol synthase [Oligoflexia bacterium]|nr:CDP-archaeol synthase [Oligoflexia bacterium]
MTKLRFVSALIAFASSATIVIFGGYPGIAIATFFVSLRLLFEYGRIILPSPNYTTVRIYFIFLGLTAFTLSILNDGFLFHAFILSSLLLFVQFLLLAKKDVLPLEELVNKTGLCNLGIIYAGVCPVYISLTTRLSNNLEWFIFTLLAVFAGDIAAYFVGRKFGRTKLFSRISPNKSVEGALASLFATIFIGLLIRHYLISNIDVFLMFILCILTSISAQVGDLCESFLKRAFNTKDSGQIMPGHGGLLDRLDGVLFAAPVVYIFVKYLVIK